jgi:hypothetical protein
LANTARSPQRTGPVKVRLKGAFIRRYLGLLCLAGAAAGNANLFGPFWPAPGKEHYYKTSIAPVDFYLLDSDSNEPDRPYLARQQAGWLREQLSASNARWKIVVCHHPPCGSYRS